MVRSGQNHRHRIAARKKTSASHRNQKLTIAEVYSCTVSVDVRENRALHPVLSVQYSRSRLLVTCSAFSLVTELGALYQVL